MHILVPNYRRHANKSRRSITLTCLHSWISWRRSKIRPGIDSHPCSTEMTTTTTVPALFHTQPYSVLIRGQPKQFRPWFMFCQWSKNFFAYDTSSETPQHAKAQDPQAPIHYPRFQCPHIQTETCPSCFHRHSKKDLPFWRAHFPKCLYLSSDLFWLFLSGCCYRTLCVAASRPCSGQLIWKKGQWKYYASLCSVLAWANDMKNQSKRRLRLAMMRPHLSQLPEIERTAENSKESILQQCILYLFRGWIAMSVKKRPVPCSIEYYSDLRIVRES